MVQAAVLPLSLLSLAVVALPQSSSVAPSPDAASTTLSVAGDVNLTGKLGAGTGVDTSGDISIGGIVVVDGSTLQWKGGKSNGSGGTYATVGGGNYNSATGHSSTVAGGQANRATGGYASVGGGRNNTASGLRATVAGGYLSVASALNATVGGGQQNNASGDGATIGGGQSNSVGANARYATVGGGSVNYATGSYSAVAGGLQNTAAGWQASIGGGGLNGASSMYATVGGGRTNVASGKAATVAGGYGNTASSAYSAITGGVSNSADGAGATVMGGRANRASGAYSFAAGRNARALHDGAFVWGDGGDSDRKVSPGPHSFTVHASGGTRFYSDGDARVGVGLAPGSGAWSSLSDRDAKENLEPVDPRRVLERVVALPLSTWNYKAQDSQIRHMGPTAQDFHAAFGLGVSERTIDTVDPDGVALAAIQGLSARDHELEARLAEKDAELAALRDELASLKELVSELVATGDDVFAAPTAR